MFKNLLRLRHDASSKDVNRPLPPQYGHGTKQPLNNIPSNYSVSPVDYDYEGPRMWSELSASSVNPVEYRQSPLAPAGPPAPAGKPTSAFSVNPVEYRQSPMGYSTMRGPGAPGPPVASSTQSPFPVDYQASAPMPTPRQAARPKPVANDRR